MLVISENILDKYKNSKYVVYSKEKLSDGVECFSSKADLNESESYFITSVGLNHIQSSNGKFYYTEDDLSNSIDWFPAQIIDVGTKFKKSCKKKSKLGTAIKSNKCIVDVSGLPAFKGCTNEDISVNEYRFYLTLFNDYTIEQVRYERHDLYDAQFKSSKYDLVSKLQDSDFLKSKDFKIINSKREKDESVQVGLIVKEDTDNSYSIDYGRVFINMNNQVSIVWH